MAAVVRSPANARAVVEKVQSDRTQARLGFAPFERAGLRVRCAPDVRRRFLAYWFVVRPGSGMIRRSMLRAIRRQAEGSAASPLG